MKWLYLAVAILAEIVATSALKSSDGFTRLLPSVVTTLGYVVSFYFLSLTLREVPVGIAYAIWSGVGIVLISIVSALLFKQHLDAGDDRHGPHHRRRGGDERLLEVRFPLSPTAASPS